MVKTRSGDVSPEDKLSINAGMPVKDIDVREGVEDKDNLNDLTVSSQQQDSSDEKDVTYYPGYGRELRNRFVFGYRAQRDSRKSSRVSSRSRNRRFADESLLDVSQNELTDDDDNEIFSPRERRVRRKKSSRHHSSRRLSRGSRAHHSQVMNREEIDGRDSPEDKVPDSREVEGEGEGVRRSTRNRKLTYDSFNTTWILGTQTLHGYPNMYTREKSNKAMADVEDGGGDAHAHKKRLPAQQTVAYQMYMTDDDKEDEKADEDKKIERGMKRTRNSLNEVDTSGGMDENGDVYKDMYSRVKRRRPIKRYLNGKGSTNTREMEDDPTETQSSQSSTDDESGHDNNNVVRHRKYSLRQTKPTVERYQVNNDPPQKGRCSRVLRSVLRNMSDMRRRRRRSSTSSSSSSSSSSSEDRFEGGQHKKTKTRNSRCLPPPVPLNMDVKALPSKKSKPSTNLADVDPMALDRSIMFVNVGGLHEHIRCLQEMVVFPMMYREVFDRFHIQPAKGVLFHGPPGTGKTLLARALANECSRGDRKVAFFMRKGADCLTKWVGESERQLRLLFEQAYQMRPSIIFFDEIDGLAPVRSSKQEQIHASIVSTLLALMDGLDSRGDVVVIGATNRIDAIDPALRRPGRFDRELYFPLPAQKERQEILRIHVSNWESPPSSEVITTLAEQATGYCGSDLRALCSEAVLHGLRRRYPQIYKSNQKLLLNPHAVQVEPVDFLRAKSTIVPAAHRSAPSHGRKLPVLVEPLLKSKLEAAIKILGEIFPHGMSRSVDSSKLLSASQSVHRPHLLIAGTNGGHGQNFVGRALLHFMEHVTMHTLDLETLYRTSSQTAEEACIQLFNEARRNLPSIIFVPTIDKLWGLISETVRSIFLMKLDDIDAASPVLLLATSESLSDDLPEEISSLFSSHRDEVLTLSVPTASERRAFFSTLILEESIKPPQPVKGSEEDEVLEELPLAPPPSPVKLTEAELKMRVSHEEKTLRELRIFLRDCCSKLARNRLFFMFTKPVDIEVVPDYLNIIKQPMDLETMMTNIDMHCYSCAQDFLDDIDLVVRNALEYNPDRSGEDKLIRHRACSLRDRAYAMIKEEMDTDYEEQCKKIKVSRAQRAESPSRFVPDFIHTKPAGASTHSNDSKGGSSSQPSSYSTPLPQLSQRSSQSQNNVHKSLISNDVQSMKRNWNLEQGRVRKKYRTRNSWQRGFINKKVKKRHVVLSPIRSIISHTTSETVESHSSKGSTEKSSTQETMVNGIDSVDVLMSSQEGGMKNPIVLNRDDIGESEFIPRLVSKAKHSERLSRSSVNASTESPTEDSQPVKSPRDHTMSASLDGTLCSSPPVSSQDKCVTSPSSKANTSSSSSKSKQESSPKSKQDNLLKSKQDTNNDTSKTDGVRQKVIYDQHALDQLLNRVVKVTEGCNFTTLLGVHARLQKHIERCSQDYIKFELIDLLSKELDRFEAVRRKKTAIRCS